MYRQIVFGLKDLITALLVALIPVRGVDQPMSGHLILGVSFIITGITSIDSNLVFVRQVVQQFFICIELLRTDIAYEGFAAIPVVSVDVHFQSDGFVEALVALLTVEPIGRVVCLYVLFIAGATVVFVVTDRTLEQTVLFSGVTPLVVLEESGLQFEALLAFVTIEPLVDRH